MERLLSPIGLLLVTLCAPVARAAPSLKTRVDQFTETVKQDRRTLLRWSPPGPIRRAARWLFRVPEKLSADDQQMRALTISLGKSIWQFARLPEKVVDPHLQTLRQRIVRENPVSTPGVDSIVLLDLGEHRHLVIEELFNKLKVAYRAEQDGGYIYRARKPTVTDMKSIALAEVRQRLTTIQGIIDNPGSTGDEKIRLLGLGESR